MRVFVTRWFARFARKADLSEGQLCAALARAERGSIDANLGGSLIKQRVARAGKGRSGGYRTLIAHHPGARSVFIYGFAKNERDNIDAPEMADLKRLVEKLLSFTDAEVERALKADELKELDCSDEEEGAAVS